MQEGWQLENARDPSNVITNELVSRSNILYFVRMIGARLRFGSDVQAGARHAETLLVGHLAYYPDRPDVREAWKSTLDDLSKTFDACEEHGFPVVLVAFPFAFQFENVDGLSTPQHVVCSFAQSRGVPVIDLLPVFDAHRNSEGVDVQKYFLDDLHPSALGGSIVADTLARFIMRANLLSAN